MITLAMQKKGRLSEKTLDLLKKCGIKIQNGSTYQLKAKSSNFPLEVLFLRDDDIPESVASGIADIGIVGENVYLEKNREVTVVEKLGFSKCRLSIAVPKDMEYNGIKSLAGKNIATSYPNILRKFLNDSGVNVAIHEISGSVEIAPGIGLAEGIFDIVSTGSTLISNGLKEVETVIKSEAILIAAPNLNAEKTALVNKLLFRIRASRKADDYKYILLNAPNDKLDEICTILPGMKSPTILPLAESDWSSLHSVIREDEYWEIIEKLKDLGAQGILIIPIEQMVV